MSLPYLDLYHAFLVSVSDIKSYIEKQHDLYLEEEGRIKRNPKFEDTRVHVVLYFLPPYLSSPSVPSSWRKVLSALDAACLAALAPLVNIIPVIAKADALTKEQLAGYRSKVFIYPLTRGCSLLTPAWY